MIRLFGKPLRVSMATSNESRKTSGSDLFVGNLSADVNEKVLFDTFSAFGLLANTPKIMRKTEDCSGKGHGFISFDDFEAADAAIVAMNGQYLMNQKIIVQYAFKKDYSGIRHGTVTERQLSMQLQSRR
eukprot:gnl/MRDRNA2_/MRDRNA2_82146_c0_seq2.p1 gnl/MRDRNA2_/MRDRNA2_82146_c0~~gnl/MRDRNA2_/MRDRNA2_82146_c0_seq2.p1  ORF type:complete len:129 (+),score=11.23 gnl/MRDRNA2_/MRDRNA2_82146_c0_seq2:180-566(+)